VRDRVHDSTISPSRCRVVHGQMADIDRAGPHARLRTPYHTPAILAASPVSERRTAIETAGAVRFDARSWDSGSATTRVNHSTRVARLLRRFSPAMPATAFPGDGEPPGHTAATARGDASTDAASGRTGHTRRQVTTGTPGALTWAPIPGAAPSDRPAGRVGGEAAGAGLSRGTSARRAGPVRDVRRAEHAGIVRALIHPPHDDHPTVFDKGDRKRHFSEPNGRTTGCGYRPAR
jgi:hypothetical protein